MTDEPTPPPVVADEPQWVEPPPRLESEPRNPVGWIVTALLLLMSIVSAVGGYVKQDDEPKSYSELQRSLHTTLSLGASSLPGSTETTKEKRKEQLTEIYDEAVEASDESEEAARIAAVTARELGKPISDEVYVVLMRGKEDESHLIARVLSKKEPSQRDVEALEGVDSNEFAVKLAKAQAREAIGQPGRRSEILDSNLLLKTGAVGTLGVFAFVVGVACLIFFLSGKASGRITPVGLGDVTKPFGDRMAIRFAVYSVLFVGVSLTIGLAFDPEKSPLPIPDLWTQVIAMVVVFGLLLASLRIPVMDKADGYSDLVGEKRPFLKLVGLGLYGYLCTVPLLTVAIGFIALLSKVLPEPTHPLNEEMASASGLGWLAIFLVAAVMAPLIEELAFRGILFPALASQIKKPWVSMVACGLIFAAIHPQGPLVWPALATTGATAAALRYYTGSLIPCIVLHMVHNSVIVVFGMLIG